MYTSIYRDIIYSGDTLTNPVTYFMNHSGNTIFQGKVYKSLSDNLVHINAGRIIRDYIRYPRPNFSVSVAHNSNIPILEFILFGDGEEMERYLTVPDRRLPWNGESRPISMPISKKYDPRMRLPFSYISRLPGQISEEVGYRNFVFELDGDFDLGWEGNTYYYFVSECTDLNGYTVGVPDEYSWIEVEGLGDTVVLRVAENRDSARTGSFYVEWLDDNFNTQRKYYEVNQEAGINYADMYLTFEPLNDTVIGFTISTGTRSGGTVQYRFGEGAWKTVQFTIAPASDYTVNIPGSSGSTIQVRHNISSAPSNPKLEFILPRARGSSGSTTGWTAGYNVYGNPLSMYYGADFIGKSGNTENSNVLFGYTGARFSGVGVGSAKNLYIPDGYNCGMLFKDNIFLTEPPVLPRNSSYSAMFIGCTSLVNAPEIPPVSAITYKVGDCGSMFSGCTSLVNGPSALPATVLVSGAYINMFAGCTSLVNVPAILPATALSTYCYYGMFAGCTSLVNAPELPAETLVDYCYYEMFSGCSSLRYIKCLATNQQSALSIHSTENWVYGVPNRYDDRGTFVKKAGSNWSRTYNGIPDYWEVQEV